MNKRIEGDESVAAERTAPSMLPESWGKHDHSVLVLQGGGALGAHQGGVYEGLMGAGVGTDWVAGVSIGGD